MAIIDPFKDDPNFPFIPLLQPGQEEGTLWIYNPASWQRREDVHHTVRGQTALPQGEACAEDSRNRTMPCHGNSPTYQMVPKTTQRSCNLSHCAGKSSNCRNSFRHLFYSILPNSQILFSAGFSFLYQISPDHLPLNLLCLLAFN